jgi:hypothetical protein
MHKYLIEVAGSVLYRPSLNCSIEDRVFYGTPIAWVEACRDAMGSIELDPASCFEANEAVVKADRFYDRATDGLKQSWESRSLFMNPPWNTRREQLLWANKLISELDAGNVNQAIVLGNNNTDAVAFHVFGSRATAIALPQGRIQFISVYGRGESSNTRGQIFFYFGNCWSRFYDVFTKKNCLVMRPIHA